MSTVTRSLSHSRSVAAAESLRIEGIGKRFGGLRVFENISLELRRDDVLGVIGPNGAGKTTLINVLCGMLAPSSGRISLGEQEITDLPFHSIARLGVVRTFQQTNTFGSASVGENLMRARRFSGTPKLTDEGLDALLDEFGLSKHLSDRSAALPYGKQKMLGLVLALITRPKFLLMDEPAAGLEHRERRQIDRFIEYARRTYGCGILLVEHDMGLIRRLCPEIVVLEAGRLLARGSPADVLSRSDVIAAYLGTAEE
jgi:branched-chain amino acid transport system ATP-binding protein